MGEKSNEDYTPIKYKLKNKELGLNGFYEYKKKTENPNQIELRKITCENYAKNTDEENSENTDEEKCKEFKESDVKSGEPLVIDLNKKTSYIKFLKELLNNPDELYDDDDDLPDNLKLTEEQKNNTPPYITDFNKYIELSQKKAGKRKTRRHRKNSKKNKNRSSKKRKSNKKKRKTVKKRRLRKQK